MKQVLMQAAVKTAEAAMYAQVERTTDILVMQNKMLPLKTPETDWNPP